MPVNVRVLTWSRDGGNLFEDTLGDITLDNPVERKKTLRWGSAVVPPASGAFDKIGVELRTFLPAVAYEPPPQHGAYALVEYDGRGILDYGEWIHAVLQLWVQCRGELFQLIDCHGLHYVIAPAVEVIGLSQARRMADKVLRYYMAPHMYMVGDANGWRWREPAPGEYGRWQEIDAHPTRGPFATAEEALRDAVAALGMPRPTWFEDLAMFGMDTEVAHAAAKLHQELAASLENDERR